MATHFSIFAWRIPWKEEPGGLQSIGSKSRTQLEQLSMHVEEISIQIAINGHKYSSKSVS